MATSKELYAEQQQLQNAKVEFDSNVASFLSKCKSAASKAQLVLTDCLRSNDSNIKMCASSGGSITKMVDSINRVQENVSSALATADASIQSEIDRLGQLAAEAAIREAAAAQAAALARAKAQEVVKSVAQATATQASQVIKPKANNIDKV